MNMFIRYLTDQQLSNRHLIDTQYNKKTVDCRPNDGVIEVSLTRYCIGQMSVDQMVIHHLTDQQLSDRHLIDTQYNKKILDCWPNDGVIGVSWTKYLECQMSVDQMVIHHLTNQQLSNRHLIDTQYNKKTVDCWPNDGVIEVSLTRYCIGQMSVDQRAIHHLTDQQWSNWHLIDTQYNKKILDCWPNDGVIGVSSTKYLFCQMSVD